jgi:Mn-containing catalase
MFLKIAKIPVLLPLPSKMDATAAAQLLAMVEGRFGEIAIMKNYEHQARSYCEQDTLCAYQALIANIAAEKREHLELVRTMFHVLLSGQDANAGVSSVYAPGLDAARATWAQEYFFWSGNIALDLMHNLFLENGSCAHKVRIYERVTNPAVAEMIGYLYVRGIAHTLAYAKAIEALTGTVMGGFLSCMDLQKNAWPEVRKYLDHKLHLKLYLFGPQDAPIKSIWEGRAPAVENDYLEGELSFIDISDVSASAQPRGDGSDNSYSRCAYDHVMELAGQIHQQA